MPKLDLDIMITQNILYNSNGKHLAEFALLNDLFQKNTKFKHKMCHRTTWTGPGRRN